MEYIDRYVSDKSTLSMPLSIIAFLVLLFGSYPISAVLISSYLKMTFFNDYFFDLIISGICFYFFSLNLLALGIHIIDGKYLVRKIEINNIIILENSFKNKLSVEFLDVNFILNETKGFIFNNIELYIKNKRRGFKIYLRDGRYFRVSPHMERIDELKAKLEEIIDNNKNSDD